MTGLSAEPGTGTYVMARVSVCESMDEITASDVADRAVIARCRELLGAEAVGLSDEDVDRICRHAEAMAHLLIEIFRAQRATVA